jgi:hypothetical protein
MTPGTQAPIVKRGRARPRRNDVDPRLMRDLKSHGRSLRAIAKELRVGYGTVRRFLAELAPEAPGLSQKSAAALSQSNEDDHFTASSVPNHCQNYGGDAA